MPTPPTPPILQILATPAHPECEGTNWAVTDEDKLAKILAKVFVGRIAHAKTIIKGADISNVTTVILTTKEEVYKQLHPSSETTKHHRDGLIFEFMTWIFAVLSGSDQITHPHAKATFQGTDGLRLDIDVSNKAINCLHVHEVKCTNDTDHSRTRITNEVFPNFIAVKNGEKEREILFQLNALLENLFQDAAALESAIQNFHITRPIAFHACVTANPLDTAGRIALFANYSQLNVALQNRHGHTFEQHDVRAWFEQISQKIWQSVEDMAEPCMTQQVNA